MISKEEEKEIIKRDRKFVKQRAKDYANQNEKIFREHFRYLKEGKSEEESIELLCERFDCKPRRIKNQINKRTGALNPATKAINDTMILGRVNSLLGKAEKFDDFIDEEYERALGVDGDWIEVEMSTANSGNIIKKVNKFKYIASLMKQKIENDQEFFKAVKSLIPQTVLNQTIDNRSIVDQYSDEELDERLRVANE